MEDAQENYDDEDAEGEDQEDEIAETMENNGNKNSMCFYFHYFSLGSPFGVNLVLMNELENCEFQWLLMIIL